MPSGLDEGEYEYGGDSEGAMAFDHSSESSDPDDFIAKKEQMQKQLNAMIATTLKP